MPVTIFFCYAREDEALLNKLKSRLHPLERQGLIEFWYDRDISAGAEWEPEIKQQLATAQVILLLISPDFMNSDYCYGIEMKQAMERLARGEAITIPIILRPSYWHIGPLGKLQALPTDGKPITSCEWEGEDNAFYDVTQGIHKVVEKLTDFNAERLSLLRTLTGHKGNGLEEYISVAINPDGRTLISGSADKTIKIWRNEAFYTYQK